MTAWLQLCATRFPTHAGGVAPRNARAARQAGRTLVGGMPCVFLDDVEIYVQIYVESVEMSLPKSLTPALIRKLNLACDRRYEEAQRMGRFTESACCDCISAGWCGACWDAVTGRNDNAMIGGNQDGKGAGNG